MKTCTVCKIPQSLDNYFNSKVSKDGKGYRCKACDSIARAKWAEDNPERSKLSSRRRSLKHKYGMSLEDYDSLLAYQGGKCGICSSPDPRAPHHSTTFCVDHDHKTGAIRGLLCSQCNRGLGFLGDTKEAVENALVYLTKLNKRAL